MSGAAPIYVSRLVRLPLVDAEGIAIGRLDDVVLSPSGPGAPPRVLGFVAVVQRRRIFVNANRVGEIDASGVRLSSGTVDLRRFELRPGELLARRHVLDRPTGADVVNDLALQASTGRFRSWEVAAVSVGPRGLLRRRRKSLTAMTARTSTTIAARMGTTIASTTPTMATTSSRTERKGLPIPKVVPVDITRAAPRTA